MSITNMYQKLMVDKWIESDSPKNRKKLYALLKKNKITYITKIIGYTNGKKNISRWSDRKIGWDLGRVVKWITHKRILESDLMKACEISNNFDFDKIKQIFSEEIPMHEKYNIIQREWGEQLKSHKWTPFDYCYLRKTIVRIQLDAAK
ncbi:hypothetical protein QJ857_gp0635 [Tupanvirus soda lake]|uniref:Uncharacterized protein n=2 Tax=Tupanvirus TaxID=2094720 RepID=A0A6N1NVH8_9VIRU|nr:hypothetical protein QJ857_gp0635 [Tupanvirus soda lake]QKU35408.1 hypothetical protein [Tupanvirus soda lake]